MQLPQQEERSPEQCEWTHVQHGTSNSKPTNTKNRLWHDSDCNHQQISNYLRFCLRRNSHPNIKLFSSNLLPVHLPASPLQQCYFCAAKSVFVIVFKQNQNWEKNIGPAAKCAWPDGFVGSSAQIIAAFGANSMPKSTILPAAKESVFFQFSNKNQKGKLGLRPNALGLAALLGLRPKLSQPSARMLGLRPKSKAFLSLKRVFACVNNEKHITQLWQTLG